MKVKELIELIKNYPEYELTIDAFTGGTETDSILANVDNVCIDSYDGGSVTLSGSEID